MKLAAIFNAWSDCQDLLVKSVDNILPVVDLVIIIWSDRSNKGEELKFTFRHHSDHKVQFVNVEPIRHFSPAQNETMKRNAGLDYARANLCTHFLVMDSDEFYLQSDIRREGVRMEREELNGLVCGLRVYVKEPTLWCEDHTLVPFIQKLTPEVRLGAYHYPFTYDKDKRCHIDPTRRPSHISRISWSDVIMHHFSYVRKDMNLKIRNSTANLERSRDVIEKEMREARPGWMSLLYHRELKETDNIFGI